MTLILVLIVIVLIVSFVCSLVEAVFLSITPTYISIEKKESPRTGLLMEHLKDNINRPILAVLSLNTIANTFGAALIGAKVQEVVGDSALTIFSAIFTFCVIVFAEFIPKTLGAMYWKSLAEFATYTLQLIIILIYPIVWLGEKLSNTFKRSGDEEASVTREEVIATAELSMHEGELEHKESTIIKNLLMMDNMFVSDIMTPRSVIFALDASMTVEEVFEKFKPIRFSRIPVFEGSLDNMVGLVMRYRIHESVSSDHHDLTITEILVPIASVPENMTVTHAIDYFIKRKEHLALVQDEYGVTTGLVTLEDAIETLLGVEIVDELDHVSDMRQFALEQWQTRKSQVRR